LKLGLGLSVLLAVIASLAPSGGAAAGLEPKVTLIGDSVADAMEHNPVALASLNDGFRLNLQTRGCRALVTPSCWIADSDGPPPTALAVVKRFGRWIGKIVVVEVGYNDKPASYDRDVDTVMRALQDAGVKTVLWLTMRDPQHAFLVPNTAIRAKPKEWPQFAIADWDRYAAGHADWFEADGFHPTELGATELGRFIHDALHRATQRTRR
jgi:ribosomal protein L25 (general stress protein Ctc)